MTLTRVITVMRRGLFVAGAVMGMWTQAAAQSVGFQQALGGTIAGSRFGVSTAVDGPVAVVGTDASNGSPAHVLIRVGAVWSRQLLRPSDGTLTDRFGRAVAVSGTTLAIGAPGAAQGGAVYIFVWNGASWVEQAKLAPMGGLEGSANFGRTVAIEGNTVVVGAQFATLGAASGAGRAYVFERTGTTWAGQELNPLTTLALQDYFGGDVDVSGSTVCVGATESSGTSRNGSVYVFTRGASAWALEQRVVPPTALGGDNFGTSCAVDGDTLVAGTWTCLQLHPHRRDLAGKSSQSVAVLSGQLGRLPLRHVGGVRWHVAHHGRVV